MHVGNIEWLRDLNRQYDFAKASLLELGSLNINGTARDYLRVAEWVGIDLVAGRDVDIVCPANATSFSRTFDVILCTSMIEHDPNWRASLDWNLQWLRPGGHFLLSWGAEGNLHHLPEPWALVPLADVTKWAADRDLVVLESFWEGDRYTFDCPGCYDMVLQSV